MKHFLITITLLLFSTFSQGQYVKSLNETAEQFATRVKPDHATLTHKVLAVQWNSTPVILAFYQQHFKFSPVDDPDQANYTRIIATAFVQTDSNHFNKLLIDTIDSDGGDPNIECVFFANADKDAAREIIIIASWQQQHYDVEGTLYSTYVYDNLQTTPLAKLILKKNISTRLSGGCDCEWRDGRKRKAPYQKAADVRIALKKMGYK